MIEFIFRFFYRWHIIAIIIMLIIFAIVHSTRNANRIEVQPHEFPPNAELSYHVH